MIKKKTTIQPKGLFDTASKGYPWSHVVKARGSTFVALAGQSPQNSAGELVGRGDIKLQVEQCLRNVKIAIEAAGGTMDDIVSCIWFVTDSRAFFSEGASELRRKYFKKGFPASTLVEVLPWGFQPDKRVEVQCYAVLGS